MNYYITVILSYLKNAMSNYTCSINGLYFTDNAFEKFRRIRVLLEKNIRGNIITITIIIKE